MIESPKTKQKRKNNFGKDQKSSYWFYSLLCYYIYYMKKYPIHVTWAQGKTLNTLCITCGLSRKKCDIQFTTVTTHKNFQNYYNEKCAKYLFDLKKYRGVIFHDTEGWCKIWKKTDLWFGKWHKEYGKFPPEEFKVSQLG